MLDSLQHALDAIAHGRGVNHHSLSRRQPMLVCEAREEGTHIRAALAASCTCRCSSMPGARFRVVFAR